MLVAGSQVSMAVREGNFLLERIRRWCGHVERPAASMRQAGGFFFYDEYRSCIGIL
jgi:hypothetical protein